MAKSYNIIDDTKCKQSFCFVDGSDVWGHHGSYMCRYLAEAYGVSICMKSRRVEEGASTYGKE